MTKSFFLFVLLILNAAVCSGQTDFARQRSGSLSDSVQTKPKQKFADIKDYLIISFERDTTYVDTTLSIQKDYKFNYLRKDNFGLMPFSNIGQTYNSLSHHFESNKILPQLGARAKHFNYYEVEDMNYYHVPTPLTELMYKTAFQQGQLLDAFFTVNMTRQFNFSIAYKGLRSLGKYQHILTSTGNFAFTANYLTENSKYGARAHVVMQDFLNQENGGLKDEDIEKFESGDPEFQNRSVFAPNFENAQNNLEGKRFYLDHFYNILKPSDSLVDKLHVGQIISFEDKYYQFAQAQRSDFFGDAFLSTKIDDKVTLEHVSNQFFAGYKNEILGDLRFNIDYNNYNYGYNSVTIIDGVRINNRIKGSVFGIGGSYKNTFGKFKLDGEFGLNLSGDFKGIFLDANAAFDLNEDFSLTARLNSSSKLPNFNMLLYQSDYLNYNWDHTGDFENIKTQNLSFEVESKKFANAAVEYSTINNHTYFTKNADQHVKPTQAESTINYIKVTAGKEFHFGKFALDNTIMYQKVTNGASILNVPEIITRNTLYFSDHLFKKALFLQTGITLNYFSNYYMDGYDPLLAEFYVQNTTVVGNFPRLDFFINAKVRQTRIFLKAEHFNASMTGYNYFSAPNNPYRDFSIRFGIVWNFFM